MSTNIQITPQGISSNFLNRNLQGRSFALHHCVLLRNFLADSILKKVHPSLVRGVFVSRSYGAKVGRESCMKENEGWNLLHFLMNDPVLFKAIKTITGLSKIGFFSGRIYRMETGENHYLDWHNDLRDDRQLALSVNLSQKSYQGGRLQLRARKTQELLYESPNLEAGDALLFRIHKDLEHRLTKVEGAHPRVVYAGWFYPKPQAPWFNKKQKRVAYASL